MLYTFACVTPVQIALYDHLPPPPGMNTAQAKRRVHRQNDGRL